MALLTDDTIHGIINNAKRHVQVLPAHPSRICQRLHQIFFEDFHRPQCERKSSSSRYKKSSLCHLVSFLEQPACRRAVENALELRLATSARLRPTKDACFSCYFRATRASGATPTKRPLMYRLLLPIRPL